MKSSFPAATLWLQILKNKKFPLSMQILNRNLLEKNKKILFLFPNTANNPAIANGIAILAGIAKRLSWEMDYIDTYIYDKKRDSMEDRENAAEFRPSNLTASLKHKPFSSLKPDIEKKIETFKPSILAVSCMSFEYEFLMSFIRDINIPDDILLIIGGIHAILRPEEIIETGMFDIVCIGEGEVTFFEILKTIEDSGDISGIKNTYYYDRRNGNIKVNEKRRLMSSDQLWKYQPDYSFFKESYFIYPFDGKLYRRVNFEIGRGCPFNCTYCGNSALKKAFKGLGNFIRIRPLESIKKGLRHMIENYDVEMFYLEDECFLSHAEDWLRNFAEWYGSEIRLPFIIQTRPETITEKKILILKQMRAPFFQVSMGVESGSERILYDICNRKLRVDKIIESFDLLHKHNVRTCAFFMIGFPYETREEIFDSIRLCKRIRPDVAIVSIFQPMPGQRLRDISIEEGFIKGDEPLFGFTEGSILNMPQISSEEIVNLRRVFLLYTTLPEDYSPEIERCERDFERNRDLYDKLVKLRWSRYCKTSSVKTG